MAPKRKRSRVHGDSLQIGSIHPSTSGIQRQEIPSTSSIETTANANEDIPSADLVKLVYLATKIQRKRTSTRNVVQETVAEKVGEVLKKALNDQSFNSVKTFVEDQMSKMRNETYSNGYDETHWWPKYDFMSWFLSMKHLQLDTSSLDSVVDDVRELCGMEDIDEVEEVFMNNENLVMSKICDLMTNEQVTTLWALCSEEKKTSMPDFKKITNSTRPDTPGIKELVFFYIIRYLELKNKFNTLYTDILLKYIGKIRSSQVGSTGNLDQVCKILETYEILVRPVGYCLVFCVVDKRPGAKQEIRNIKNTFGARLGYKVVVKQNPTKENIETEAKLCSTFASCGIYDSFVCFLLAHGDPVDIELFGGVKISRKYFLQMFANKTCFPKKPKLFLMGSCQGSKILPGRRLSGKGDQSDAVADPQESRNVPVPERSDRQRDIDTVHAESDRLVAYATLPHHTAYRNATSGSYFVTYICDHIQELENRAETSINVVEVLQRANRSIHSILFKDEDPKGIERLGKQACYYESTLQKNFCFRLTRRDST